MSKINTNNIKAFLANFVIPLSALILIVVVFFAVGLPSFRARPELRMQLTEKQALSDKLAEKYRKLNDMLDFKSSVEENKTLVSSVLVSEPLVPQLLTQIDMIAKESGLAVQKLSYALGDSQGEKDVLDYDVVYVNLGVEGTYSQVVTFLQTLENAGRVVNVNNVRYNTSTEDPNILSVSFVLVSPYVQLQTAAVTDDPIEFDIADKGFQDLMARLKALKIYQVSIDEVIDIQDLEEETQPTPQSTPSAPTP